ncbi:MAG: response regulator, partial [Candidatus Omnitrophica bacterium]|nr:response regulator [Candidatus Omnitrophota bacterium]
MDKKKILIVDDDPDFLELIKLRLEHAGYEVYVASNGEEGVEKFSQVKPDLI